MTTLDGTVGEMLAYAFSGHRRGASESTAAHRESFVEWCIRYACKWEDQAQLFLDAIYRGQNVATFDHLVFQNVDYLQPDRRTDLKLWYRGTEDRRQFLLIELKIDAALTPAQKAPGYAELFLCSSSQESKIVRQLDSDPGVRVMTWNGLFEHMSESPRAGNADLSLWKIICSLGEELARDVKELEPLPSPRVLFNESVADNYCAAMRLLGDIVETLGHLPLMPPKPDVQTDNVNIGAVAVGGTSLLFTPESRFSPISVGIADYGKYQSILDVGAQHYYVSPTKGKRRRLPLVNGAVPDEDVYFKDQLAALKWRSVDSAAGGYLHSFLLELRNICRENPDVSIDRLPLTKQSIGYSMCRGARRFDALFDAECWAQDPSRGPFIVREKGRSVIHDTRFIIEGNETTAGEVRDRIRDFIGAELGLQSSDDSALTP